MITQITHPYPDEENSTYLGISKLNDDLLSQILDVMPKNPWSIPTVICGALMSCVAAIGILGNILNVYIFSKRSMSGASIGILLMALSAVDALLLMVAAPLFSSSAIYVHKPSFRLMTFIAYMTMYAYPCASIFQTASVWLMMLATMERFCAICFPFTARTFCTRTKAKIIVVIVMMTSVLYNACRFFEYKLTPFGNDAMAALPLLRENQQYIQIYVHWMYLIFIFAIPFVILSCVNGMVVLTIQRAKRDRRHLTRQQRKEHATASLMVIVALAYLSCNSLAFVINAMEIWGASGMHDVELPYPDYPYIGNISMDNWINTTLDIGQFMDTNYSPTTKRHSSFFYFLVDFNNLLVMLHSSLNFGIYFKFSLRFRAHVRRYICGRNADTSVEMEHSRLSHHHSNGDCKEIRKSLRSPYQNEIVLVHKNGSILEYDTGSSSQNSPISNHTKRHHLIPLLTSV